MNTRADEDEGFSSDEDDELSGIAGHFLDLDSEDEEDEDEDDDDFSLDEIFASDDGDTAGDEEQF